jgi:hypothetical protein
MNIIGIACLLLISYAVVFYCGVKYSDSVNAKVASEKEAIKTGAEKFIEKL